MYKCKLCQKCVTTKGSLLGHLRLHMGEFVGNCSKCGKGFSRIQHIREHEKLCGLSKVSCYCFYFKFMTFNYTYFCMKMSQKKRSYESSVQYMNSFNDTEEDIGDIPLTIDIINENGYTLRQIFRSHTIVDELYKCKICEKKIRNPNSFIAHLRLHTGNWVANCFRCGKGFTRMQHLKEHEKICKVDYSKVSLLYNKLKLGLMWGMGKMK